MILPDATVFIGQPVNHDVAAGIDAEARGARAMRRVRIRDVQREMILAGRIVRVDGEESLRRALIADALLVTHGFGAERDEVALYRHATVEQSERVLALVDDNAVGD